MVTASVRLEAPSLPHREATWNLAVFSLMPRAAGDAFVGQALGDELEHLQLAGGQRLGQGRAGGQRAAGAVSEVAASGRSSRTRPASAERTARSS